MDEEASMARRAIRRGDEAAVRERVAFTSEDDLCARIYFNGDFMAFRLPSAPEAAAIVKVALARAGIHPGAEGWEMEEASADAPCPSRCPPGLVASGLPCARRRGHQGAHEADCTSHWGDAPVPDGPPLAAPTLEPSPAASIADYLSSVHVYDVGTPGHREAVRQSREIEARLTAWGESLQSQAVCRALDSIDAREADARGDAAEQAETAEPSRGYLLGVWEAAKAWQGAMRIYEDGNDARETLPALREAEERLIAALDASPDAKPTAPRDDDPIGKLVLWLHRYGDREFNCNVGAVDYAIRLLEEKQRRLAKLEERDDGSALARYLLTDHGAAWRTGDTAQSVALRLLIEAESSRLMLTAALDSARARIDGLESDLEIERETMALLRATKDELAGQLTGARAKIEELYLAADSAAARETAAEDRARRAALALATLRTEVERVCKVVARG